MYFQEAEQPLDTALAFQNKAVLSICLALITLFVFIIGPILEQADMAVTAVYAAGL